MSTPLDLSAAFTTDHSILLERFSSWFGITATPLSLIKSYLLNRFYVKIENAKSLFFQLFYGVLQGSVFGPFYSSSTLHQLMTQLFLSFSTADFSHNITHLEHTILNVYITGCQLTFSQSFKT